MNDQTGRVNVRMEWFPRVFVNHHQDGWVKWLPMAEFATNNGRSEQTKCTPYFAIQGTYFRMSFSGEPTKEWDQRHLDADQVQAAMQEIHDHLRVVMRWSEAVQEKGANPGRIPAPHMKEGSQVWLDALYIRTTWSTQKWDWTQLGHFTMVCPVSPYAYEQELPVSTRINRVQPETLLDPAVNDPLDGRWVDPHLLGKSKVRRSIRCHAWRIGECIGVSYSISYVGLGTIT